MAFLLYSAKNFSKTLKVTVQKTGRLGFTDQTAKAMNLDDKTFFMFGKDPDVQADLIMVKTDQESEDAFRAIKSGDYYYLATTALFDHLNYSYKKEPVIFDVKREDNMDAEIGGEVYLLTRRNAKTRRAANKEKQEPTLDFSTEE